MRPSSRATSFLMLDIGGGSSPLFSAVSRLLYRSNMVFASHPAERMTRNMICQTPRPSMDAEVIIAAPTAQLPLRPLQPHQKCNDARERILLCCVKFHVACRWSNTAPAKSLHQCCVQDRQQDISHVRHDTPRMVFVTASPWPDRHKPPTGHACEWMRLVRYMVCGVQMYLIVLLPTSGRRQILEWPRTASWGFSRLHNAGHGDALQRLGYPISMGGDNSGAYRVGHTPPPGSFTSDFIARCCPISSKAGLHDWGLPAVYLRSYCSYLQMAASERSDCSDRVLDHTRQFEGSTNLFRVLGQPVSRYPLACESIYAERPRFWMWPPCSIDRRQDSSACSVVVVLPEQRYWELGQSLRICERDDKVWRQI